MNRITRIEIQIELKFINLKTRIKNQNKRTGGTIGIRRDNP